MGNGTSDFVTNRIFMPLAWLIYDYTGMVVSPYLLLFITVATLAGIVLYVMKSI